LNSSRHQLIIYPTTAAIYFIPIWHEQKTGKG